MNGGARGPLAGLRIVEFAGLGPGPFCGMMLADHGAEVIRVDRVGAGAGIVGDLREDFLSRSRKNLSVDLKSEDGRALVRRLCRTADGIIEGFRPGVMERLGLGPEVLREDNPKLVYGRITGWGQRGPYAAMAGHDINYIALSGALHAIGDVGGNPVPPLNLVGDFGAGGMMLAFGMLAALHHARETGMGQVIDCAMTDGTAVLMTMIYSLQSSGEWIDRRGANLLDSGAPFYGTYETADGGYVAVGAIEPQFYKALLEGCGFSNDPDFAEQNDRSRWPLLKEKLEAKFRTRTRDEWCKLFEGTDACLAPVLSLGEAPAHHHNQARRAFVKVGDTLQPAPAPRYSDTPTAPPTDMIFTQATTSEILGGLGYSLREIASLREGKLIE